MLLQGCFYFNRYAKGKKELCKKGMKRKHLIPRKSNIVAFSLNEKLKVFFTVTFFVLCIMRRQREVEKQS